MKVNVKGVQTDTFDDLTDGQTFMYEGNVYMKAYYQNQSIAVRLTDGFVVDDFVYDDVTVVDAEVTVSTNPF